MRLFKVRKSIEIEATTQDALLDRLRSNQSAGGSDVDTIKDSPTTLDNHERYLSYSSPMLNDVCIGRSQGRNTLSDAGATMMRNSKNKYNFNNTNKDIINNNSSNHNNNRTSDTLHSQQRPYNETNYNNSSTAVSLIGRNGKSDIISFDCIFGANIIILVVRVVLLQHTLI